MRLILISNSYFRIFNALKEIKSSEIFFYNTDIRDHSKLEKIFIKHRPNQVIHFASLKSVSMSCERPNLYYENNVIGSEVLFDLVIKYNVKNIVFSSSATVYGNPEYLPIDEYHPLSATNPYAQNKIDIELMLSNMSMKYQELSIKVLRYFNPIGSHSSLILGESPKGKPNNLMPYIIAVAFGKYKNLKIFGSDFDTDDGTGVRDYIHINDLVVAHKKALNYKKNGIYFFNIGTGKAQTFYNLAEAVVKNLNVTNSVIKFIAMPLDLENKYQYFTQANINKLREAHYKDNFMNLEQGVTDYLQNYLLKKDRHA